MAPVLQLGEVSWWVVCADAAKWHWYLLLCIYIFSIVFVRSFFILKKKNLVKINRRKGLQYQRVLALCAFIRRNTKEIKSSKTLFDVCVCHVLFSINLCLD